MVHTVNLHEAIHTQHPTKSNYNYNSVYPTGASMIHRNKIRGT